MKVDKGINILWLVLGLFITVESYRLNLGELGKPDSGLFPFLIGLAMTALASIMLFQPLRSREKEKKEEVNVGNILLTILFLYAYALFFERLGFVVSTFLLILFLLKFIEKKRWSITLVVALLTSLCSYILFKIWLHAALPKGILGV